MSNHPNSFNTKTDLTVNGKTYEIYSLKALEQAGHNVARLPRSLRVLLENLLRNEDGWKVDKAQIEALLNWDPKAEPCTEIAYTPARVVMQDFTGVPCIIDLAAMRDAIEALGGDPKQINPQVPVDLIIDHSMQVDVAGTPDAAERNAEIEFGRNQERYLFMKWGQQAFQNFRVVPPSSGIIHQVNLEFLGRVTMTKDVNGVTQAFPDTCVGTDSHTPMINGLGVVGWGVGGIEAEAAMLGQPVSMLIPQVIGLKLTGALPPAATTTDLVLTITRELRKKGVVGKFVEVFGPGLSTLHLADRAVIGNMSPEFGCTITFSPVDVLTLDYLKLSNREELVPLVEAYYKAQGLFGVEGPAPEFSDVVEIDLSTIQPSISGPRRPHDYIALKDSKPAFEAELAKSIAAGKTDPRDVAASIQNGASYELKHGSVIIASITSCTNTSNPAVVMAAGLLAKKAVARGLVSKPWVKTSLAPGSRVVSDYLAAAGLMAPLEALGFHVVGYGCATCIGNSGPIDENIVKAVADKQIVACSVLSGNRNFEGRIHASVRFNYLASPPLVVAYAIAGRMDIDLNSEPIGEDKDGKPVMLADVWPTPDELQAAIAQCVTKEMYEHGYDGIFDGDKNWRTIDAPSGERYDWTIPSTYIKSPSFFDGMGMEPEPGKNIEGARIIGLFGDTITTDHISPAGPIAKDSPAAAYLRSLGVEDKDFNAYGTRRGNHEVMMRGTFANIRLRNELCPGVEGGWSKYIPTGEQMSVYDAAMKYGADGAPLAVIAGAEYGTGSSRDWAAKGTSLLGIKTVIAESFERIHRSNLIGMGVLPLQFKSGENRKTLGVTGEERVDVLGLDGEIKPGATYTVRLTQPDGSVKEFQVVSRLDTPNECDYYRHGGILQFVLRQLAK
ncbi:aconitate hydratase AcnA [Candidatus Sumerlaeota bacterium]|nr:aconitate hydratase AcnA [Candidatus Sumerlaeota bacterium]